MPKSYKQKYEDLVEKIDSYIRSTEEGYKYYVKAMNTDSSEHLIQRKRESIVLNNVLCDILNIRSSL
jgi:hypothetical protein